MPELWRPIPEFPGYEASTRGRIRSFRVPRYLRAETIGRGHATVCLMQHGRPVRHRVHRLVLLAHVGPPPPGCEACHNDGDANHNALDNLRWDTHRNNMRDKLRHRTQPRGARHPNSKLTGRTARRIRAALARGEPQSRIARRHGRQPDAGERNRARPTLDRAPSPLGGEGRGERSEPGVRVSAEC